MGLMGGLDIVEGQGEGCPKIHLGVETSRK